MSEERRPSGSTTDTKTGSYGLVTLVREPVSENTFKESGVTQTLGLLRRGAGRFMPFPVVRKFSQVYGNSRVSEEERFKKQKLESLESGILEGTVRSSEISPLLNVDSYAKAAILASCNKRYAERLRADTRTAREIQRPEPSYIFGRVMSDFLEVIPLLHATELILAASNPKISQEIGNGTYRADLHASDPLQVAVEAIALLPSIRRVDLFTYAKTFSPNRASRFHDLFVSNFSQRFSGLSGVKFIELNLPPEQHEAKIDEVRADFERITPTFRQS